MRGQLSKETRLEISITRLKKSVEELLLTIKDHAHVITRHWCSACVCFVKSKDIPPISRIGVNVLGYILYARYRLRLPIEKIKESLLDLHSFRISEGEIAEKLLGTPFSVPVLINSEPTLFSRFRCFLNGGQITRGKEKVVHSQELICKPL